MRYPTYPFQQSEDVTQFFFESIGPKGMIQKVVVFTPTINPSVYNLGLADIDPETGLFDNLTVSDNSDTAKILATIVQILRIYLAQYPHHNVVFAGNSPARNRLYRMAINQAYSELAESFVLFDYRNDGWENFETNQAYELYLIALK